jgi:hypothetical protein
MNSLTTHQQTSHVGTGVHDTVLRNVLARLGDKWTSGSITSRIHVMQGRGQHAASD